MNILAKSAELAARLRHTVAPATARIASASESICREVRYRYLRLPPIARNSLYVAVCVGSIAFIGMRGKLSPKVSKIAASPAPAIVETKTEEFAEQEKLQAEQQLLELARANQQRLHAEEQRRLVIEQAAAREQADFHREQARRQQIEMARYQQQSIQLQYEAQQRASESANREMQRYRSQMVGRPGF